MIYTSAAVVTHGEWALQRKMSKNSARRFLVIDLGTQLDTQRRFAVWDTTTSRFWKINNTQTWVYIDELLGDFKAVMPEEKFQEVFQKQRIEICEQAFLLGFDRDLV